MATTTGYANTLTGQARIDYLERRRKRQADPGYAARVKRAAADPGYRARVQKASADPGYRARVQRAAADPGYRARVQRRAAARMAVDLGPGLDEIFGGGGSGGGGGIFSGATDAPSLTPFLLIGAGVFALMYFGKGKK